jgi:hypothetical protein
MAVMNTENLVNQAVEISLASLMAAKGRTIERLEGAD